MSTAANVAWYYKCPLCRLSLMSHTYKLFIMYARMSSVLGMSRDIHISSSLSYLKLALPVRSNLRWLMTGKASSCWTVSTFGLSILLF
jgi:hypothetical protein